MICPKYRTNKHMVIDTDGGQDMPNEVLRARKCKGCGFLWSTIETIQENYLRMVEAVQAASGKP